MASAMTSLGVLMDLTLKPHSSERRFLVWSTERISFLKMTIMIIAATAVNPWIDQLVTISPKENATFCKNHKKRIPIRTVKTFVPLKRIYNRKRI
jgi:hypothetical protein